MVDMVIIDEAGQTSELDSIMAIIKAKEKVVLVGDENQLRPCVSHSTVKQGYRTVRNSFI